MNMDHWYQAVWESALLEKVPNKLKLAQQDAFTLVWLPFITYASQQDDNQSPPLNSMQINTVNTHTLTKRDKSHCNQPILVLDFL